MKRPWFHSRYVDQHKGDSHKPKTAHLKIDNPEHQTMRIAMTGAKKQFYYHLTTIHLFSIFYVFLKA